MGAIAIANSLTSSFLASINISCNRIGNEGAIAIANSLPSSFLAIINISCNRIGDEGAIAIVASLPNSSVTGMDIRWNHGIGDDGTFSLYRFTKIIKH